VSEIVSRETELASLHSFIGRSQRGPAALVLEGDAGIGKSTLWLAGVEQARAQGLRVLSSQPAEAERGLAHVGLGDLFEDFLVDVLPALPAPRRRALEVALLLGEAAEDGVDPAALGLAVRSSLQQLAKYEPILVAIDDVQWFDDSSARALAFALRRLREESILLLFAHRVGPGLTISEVEEAIDAESVERLRLGPLSMGANQRLLQARLGRTLSRPALLRLHEASGGNPFYALELARALNTEQGTSNPTEPLPVPETLERLLRGRLSGLPEETRAALLLVSAVGRPTRALLRATGVSEDALEPAFAAHAIERTGEVIRFLHPLLASVLYQGLPAEDRRRTHRLLAGVVDDPVGRARHLALASREPDAQVAAALDDAAAVAGARGAIGVAAELGEHALRLTPAGAFVDAHRRTIAAARAHFAAGEVERARALAHDLVDRAPVGRLRAEALVACGEMESETVYREIALLREALPDAAGRPALQASIHQRLSMDLRFTEGLVAAEEHARASLELANQLRDDGLAADALGVLATLRFNAGERDALRRAEQAYELATATADPQRVIAAGLGLAHVLVWSVQLERARELLERLQHELAERDERRSATALWYLALVELRAARWSLAAEYGERARELSLEYARDEAETPQNLFPIALIAAHRGELDRARELAVRGCRLAERHGVLLAGLVATPGLVDLWSGHPEEAAARFAAAERTARAAEWVEPALYWWRDDYVEALLELGRVDDAVGVLDVWEADARRLDREWVLAQVTRCRGLVAAARGEVAQALALLAQAVARHEAAGDRFGRARALLGLGIVRRRGRQKRPAREAIAAALEGFETIGASGWAATARGELGRVGGRTREEGLTAAERRVAALVAEGRTNREVAAALFLGERTVASHLTHIYAKLGVRSRTELARKAALTNAAQPGKVQTF
jgi:DNA-binding CsgD family transcriptional regulator